jgi:hypothetical protein
LFVRPGRQFGTSWGRYVQGGRFRTFASGA